MKTTSWQFVAETDVEKKLKGGLRKVKRGLKSKGITIVPDHIIISGIVNKALRNYLLGGASAN